MNSSSTNNPQSARPSNWRPLLLVPVVFLLGAAATGVWFKYGKHAAGSILPGQKLSSQTMDYLRHLNSPVEIRLYSVLPSGNTPETLQAFSGRVDQLLSEFQSANEAKIHVARNVSNSGPNADAAAADGIHPFNLEKGEACFLGVTVACGTQKETLPQLKPEWEPALEYDLARAIVQVTATSPTVVKPSAPISPGVTNEIARLIPNIDGTSLDEGVGILREAAVIKMNDAGAEMETQIQAAQQQFADAQNGKSEAEQQAAKKHLQEVQLGQAEKIKQIAARLQDQITVFQQMKAAAPMAK